MIEPSSSPPLVSVLIPTLNRIALVRRAVESVLEQTFQDLEIVIIDDGSTDPIASLEAEYPKVRVVRHPRNLGISPARNTGVQAARGKYIAFLDSDDAWYPRKLERQVALMESRPEIGACTCGYRYETDEGNSEEIPAPHAGRYRTLAQGTSLAPGTTLVARTAAMREYPYDPAFPRLVDLDWALRFVKQYPVEVLQEVLCVVYRGGRPSAASVEAGNIQLIDKHGADFMRLGWFYGRQCIGKRWLEVATHYYREGNRAKGAAYLRKALLQNPLQRPSMYLRILDYILGTGFLVSIKKLRGKLRGNGGGNG